MKPDFLFVCLFAEKRFRKESGCGKIVTVRRRIIAKGFTRAEKEYSERRRLH